MKSLIATGLMIIWSAFIYAIMHFANFSEHMHDWLWSLGAAVVLLVGLIGNVWIFIGVVQEDPWRWFKPGSEVDN